MSRILTNQHPQQQSLYHTLSSGEDGKAKKKKKTKEKRECAQTKLKGVQIKSKQRRADF